MSRTRALARAVLRAPVAGRTWREVGYQALALLLAPAGLLVLVLLLLGVVLSLTFLGLPLVALALTCARGLGRVHRGLVRRVLRIEVGDPAPRPRGRDPFDGLVRTLTDPGAWAQTGLLLVQVPLAVLGAGGPLGLLSAVGVALLRSPDGSPPGVPGLVLVVLVLAGPWLLRLVVRAQVGLTRATGAQEGDSARLRRSRSAVLEGSAAEVRAIERNLHDGTQARLTAIALHVDLARHRLRADPGGAGELLDVAHTTTREAITELRTIIRGIHPPALDEGLGPALTTLAEQAGLAVETDVDLRGAVLSPAIETMAYFCVAELLANATKHADADRAWLRARATRRRLRLEVRDDGRGGADPARGSGLRGLTDRIAGVDGTLRLVSPPGLGTRVRLDLPVRA
ncbi:signal transduction histidine kinase [Kineococcus radiotolerans]|uniref:histidine kinase n=1 Tax=Kineococcus radiotolerans TaxID=131568 RepID=A0A7W4XXL8_KINRA|nr:sensor domain-containing protein [Kineococcus radiotolerans]MBB2901637.1 signal transduction histidine kinase [Kineococcus radiotolerans]